MKLDLVVTGFAFANNKVLLIKHKKLGLWLPVGGHLDPNETPDEGLRREFMEEVKLEIEFVSRPDIQMAYPVKRVCPLPFYIDVHNVGDHDHCGLCYVVHAKEPEKLTPELAELTEYGWFTEQDLHNPKISENIRKLAMRAFDCVRNDLTMQTYSSERSDQ